MWHTETRVHLNNSKWQSNKLHVMQFLGHDKHCGGILILHHATSTGVANTISSIPATMMYLLAPLEEFWVPPIGCFAR